MEAHDTPALRNSSSENLVRMSSLEPPPKPPPWMKMTSGVGLSDLAFHRSMTLNFLSLPYTTLVMSGGVVEAGFFGGALGAAFFALGFSSCAARRAVPRSAVISPMPSIRRYFMRATARPGEAPALAGQGQADKTRLAADVHGRD